MLCFFYILRICLKFVFDRFKTFALSLLTLPVSLIINTYAPNAYIHDMIAIRKDVLILKHKLLGSLALAAIGLSQYCNL